MNSQFMMHGQKIIKLCTGANPNDRTV